MQTCVEEVFPHVEYSLYDCSKRKKAEKAVLEAPPQREAAPSEFA